MSGTDDLNDIAGFLTTCLDRGGGAWEQRTDHLIDALLPGEIASSLGVEPLMALALSPDALVREPGAELATPGSPALDAFIKFASTIGSTSAGSVLPSHYRGKGLREEVSHRVTYRNCRIRSDDSPPKIKDSYYAVHFFRVEYVSDERREQIISSAIDLTTMRPNQEFADRLPHLAIDGEKAPAAEWYSGDRLERAFAVAQGDLMAHVKSHADTMLSNARRRFDVESQRLSEYYAQVELELQRRLRSETDKAKQAVISDKIAISKADGERKIFELGEKYRIRPRATLTSMVLIRQPKTFFDLLVDRGPLTRRVTFVYDSLLDRLELPLCDKCENEMTTVTVTSKGAHLCPECAA
jgi:hypothetical protein